MRVQKTPASPRVLPLLLSLLVGVFLGQFLAPSPLPASSSPLAMVPKAENTNTPNSPQSDHSNVEELLSHVESAYQSMCRDMLYGKAVSFAQGWQDWMIYHNYFRDRKWGDGFYLDIGANQATFISNTLFFDKCLGWQGICAEPQTKYHEGIRKHRGCHLVPNCVLGKDATVSTSNNGVDFSVQVVATGGQQQQEEGKGSMECVGIQTLKKQFGFDKIDLVSLDIEGNEPSVLSCWPFDTVETTMFLVETNKHRLNEVDFFFHRHGYSTADTFTNVPEEGRTSFIDNLYVKDNSRAFLHPPLGEDFTCTPEMKTYMGTWCHAFSVKLQENPWFKDCAA